MTVRCLEARWKVMYEREELTFDEESKKRVVIATPVSDTVYVWSSCEFLAL